jgi:hypothetical protein
MIAVIVASSGIAVPAQARAGAVSPSTEWDVAAPSIGPIIGGASLNDWPACRPDQIHATARTRSSTYAVLGVVTMHASHCRLKVVHAVTALLDSTGHRLAVPVRVPPYADLGTADRPDLAWDQGKGAWGFAWRGSWCGASAAYVRIELNARHYIRGPILGPQPACDAANHTRPLVERGLPGFPGAPVQPAPLEWSDLTVQLHVSPTLPDTTLKGLGITVTNASSEPVTLSPCPLYTVLVRNDRGDGGDAAFDHRLDCKGTPAVVPANGSLQLDLPAMAYDRSDLGKRRQTATVTFAMAGVAPATANTTVS